MWLFYQCCSVSTGSIVNKSSILSIFFLQTDNFGKFSYKLPFLAKGQENKKATLASIDPSVLIAWRINVLLATGHLSGWQSTKKLLRIPHPSLLFTLPLLHSQRHKSKVLGHSSFFSLCLSSYYTDYQCSSLERDQNHRQTIYKALC